VESGAVGLFLFLGILVVQLKDAYALPDDARQTLVAVTAIATVMGLMNCPYFGAGMGECLVYLAASLLAWRKIQHPLLDRS